ncbi:MAG: hypothetical protein WAO58_00170 [Fimbriimonadaceae bacterium]
MRKALPWLFAATITYAVGAVLVNTGFDERDYEGNQDALFNIDAGYTSKVLVAKDGSIYEAGTGTSDSNGKDFVLIKYMRDSDGEFVFQWRRFYDGPATGQSSDDLVSGLALDNEMNIYVGGTSYSDSTGNDVTVRSWDQDGVPRWVGRSAVTGNQVAKDMAIDPATGEIMIAPPGITEF